MTETQAVDWEERYQNGATGWQRSGVNPAFTGWLKSGALVAGGAPGRILVPGAGCSAEPAALAAAGFAVTVIDIAPSAVAFQRQALGDRGQVEHADLFEFSPAAPFDTIYDQTCLCALPPALRDRYVERLARWLRPGGTLAALFMQTGREGGPPFHCDMDGMRALFPLALWTWPGRLPEPVAHSGDLVEQPALLHRL